jgi:ABC-type sugar transport system ATPase subunit
VLHQGRLRQVGTPREIYTDPDDVLVAHQLGSPAINLLPADALGLSGAGADRVGVRPEDVSRVDGPPAGPEPVGDLSARVQQVERLGAEDVVLFDWQGAPVRALLPPDHGLRPGADARLRLAPDKLLLFAADQTRIRRAPDQSQLGEPDPAAATTKGRTHVG